MYASSTAATTSSGTHMSRSALSSLVRPPVFVRPVATATRRSAAPRCREASGGISYGALRRSTASASIAADCLMSPAASFALLLQRPMFHHFKKQNTHN